jgi:hypothetical protein
MHTYWPTAVPANVTQVPLSTLWAIPTGGSFGVASMEGSQTYGVNLTGLTPNSTYADSLVLNYTVTVPWGTYNFSAASAPHTFWYLKDTTGDGLTDSEKLRGWEVVTQNATGWSNVRWVTANPSLYATNGLTSDFQEKQFGLDPRTVDSAGSHMLDTWNLTFELGPIGSKLTVPSGANFRYWSEAGNSSSDYNWNASCQYYVPPGTTCSTGALSGAAGSGTWANLTGADSAAWASRVLWSRAALEKFVSLPGVKNASWLRATLGNSSSEWTLTVWGKLSWGANPMTASTPRDGIVDGARVNPLYDEQLLISDLWSNLTACPSPNNGGAYGWAVQFYLNWSTPLGPHELPTGGNYSVEKSYTNTQHCGSGIANYRVPIPINGTSQNQSLQVRLLVNQSNTRSSTVLRAQAFNGASGREANVTYDTASGQRVPYSFTGPNGTVSFRLSTVTSGVKTNTLLWLPTDNSTLNNLPWGLKRYTGEQAFDLIVVNDQATGGGQNLSLTSDNIPYAQNASDQYSVTLTPGLNNLLIPRGQFLYSVLGQAVLLGKNTSWTNASAIPALLGSGENSTIGYGSSNPLVNLGCYWQNRAINNTTGSLAPICYGKAGITNETGTLLGSANGIVVVAATSGSGPNVGGVPGNPSLENSSDAGAALQSVVTLNVSSQTEVDLLLAALLDNTTGGVNGTFVSVTTQVPQLGLNLAVTQELANATQASDGLFGIPQGVPPPAPVPPCTSQWCFAVNLVSGIVSVEGTVFSFVWSGVDAVAQFIDDHLPTWLRDLGAAVLARTVAAITAAGKLIARALETALSFILSAVTSLLTAALAPITNGFADYAKPVDSEMWQAQNDTQNNTAIPNSLSWQIANSLSGTAFEVALGIAAVIAIVLVITLPIDFGPELLIPLLLGLLITVAYQTAVTSGLLASVDSSFNQLSQSTFDALQNWVENPDPPNANWETASQVVLTMSAFGLEWPLGLNALFNAKTKFLTGFLATVFGFAMMISSLAFFIAEKSGSIHYTPLAIEIIGLAIGVVGVLRMFTAYSDERDPALKSLGLIVLGLSSIDLGLALYVDLGSPGI